MDMDSLVTNKVFWKKTLLYLLKYILRDFTPETQEKPSEFGCSTAVALDRKHLFVFFSFYSDSVKLDLVIFLGQSALHISPH